MDTVVHKMVQGKAPFGENFKIDTQFESKEDGPVPKIVLVYLL